MKYNMVFIFALDVDDMLLVVGIISAYASLLAERHFT